jgi:hypothetical protein
VAVAIRVSKATPMVKEGVTFSVDAEGITPAQVKWDFADGGKPEGLPIEHQWANPGTYLVTAQVELPDGRRGAGSLSVTVSLTPKYRLTVTTNEGGTVTSGDGTINCAAKSTCTYDYEEGTHISLTPRAAADFAFSQWGDGVCANQTCDLTMDKARTAQALFKPTVARLSVQIAAAGGSVKLNNQACNACTLPFTPGQNVPVSATPDEDHDFDSWDTRTCADTHAANCTTQADTTRTIVARFTPKPKHALRIDWTGKGSWYGRVKIASTRSGGKTCLSDNDFTPCVTEYVAGEKLTLTADATQTAYFAGWKGSCPDFTNNVCRLTISGPVNITADYDILH